MIRMIEFKGNGEIIEMWVQREDAPYDEYIIAIIKKGDDGYSRFYPKDGVVMIQKYLREAADEISKLNSSVPN